VGSYQIRYVGIMWSLFLIGNQSELYMASLLVKNGFQKDKCDNEIENTCLYYINHSKFMKSHNLGGLL
jgi:hypothetical protein